MRRLTIRATAIVTAGLLAGLGAGGPAASTEAAPPGTPDPAPSRSPALAPGVPVAADGPAARARRQRLERIALPLGLQVAKKHQRRPKLKVGGTTLRAPNPYLSLVPDPSTIDFTYWANRAELRGAQRVRPRAEPPFLYEEQEPTGLFGANDRQANAELIPGFGLGYGEGAAVRIQGQLAPPPPLVSRQINTRENQGSIPKATRTRIPRISDRVVVSSRIGDGPHGRARSGRGDFDFFRVRAQAGQTIAATMLRQTNFDTVLVLYDSDGNEVAVNDDAVGTLRSDLRYGVETDGVYYVMVTGFLALPRDPFRAGSGTGAESQGKYRMRITVSDRDVDYYAVDLQAGDVLGGKVEDAARSIAVYRPDGDPRIRSSFNLSFIYPMASPLPGGGNGTFAYVAEEAGRYAVAVDTGSGSYATELEVYRPGADRSGSPVTQRLFLDFDGERVNTGVWGGRGVVELSPLSAFLGRWGLSAGQLDDLIDQVVASVTETIDADLAARGLNGDFDIEILNSRDDPDPFGEADVSRVIVGGTIVESGVATIGIAQSIDPGNYEREETGLLLLDILSDPDANTSASLNAYMDSTSDRVAFVGRALGNIAAHEAGHFIGSFHVDPFNDVPNIMDAGGNFEVFFGVGPDMIGGTADDVDVDLGVDTFYPGEAFSGLEDTLNVSSWSSSGP